MPLLATNRVCLCGFGHSGACGEGRALQGKTLTLMVDRCCAELMRGGGGAEEARRANGAEEGTAGGGGATARCGGVGGERPSPGWRVGSHL
jgi:hypothetical protein